MMKLGRGVPLTWTDDFPAHHTWRISTCHPGIDIPVFMPLPLRWFEKAAYPLSLSLSILFFFFEGSWDHRSFPSSMMDSSLSINSESLSTHLLMKASKIAAMHFGDYQRRMDLYSLDTLKDGALSGTIYRILLSLYTKIPKTMPTRHLLFLWALPCRMTPPKNFFGYLIPPPTIDTFVNLFL